jgi:hypothetical protein
MLSHLINLLIQQDFIEFNPKHVVHCTGGDALTTTPPIYSTFGSIFQ